MGFYRQEPHQVLTVNMKKNPLMPGKGREKVTILKYNITTYIEHLLSSQLWQGISRGMEHHGRKMWPLLLDPCNQLEKT